jgi:hypothetical protein
VEVIAALRSASGASWLPPLRLAVVALSFCPIVSLIGAKRPQHAAWNFIVLSLWAIVVLPAAETFFLQRGQRLEMGDARGWFLWILIALGPINFLPTRFWNAAVLLAFGQTVALSPHLPLLRRSIVDRPETIGLALVAGSLVLALVAFRRHRNAANRYDRQWLDFRDTFGLLWSLRVQERLNAVAKQHGWDLELSWAGFRSRASDAPLDEIDPDIQPLLRSTLRALLRRFVSSRWIAERLGSEID